MRCPWWLELRPWRLHGRRPWWLVGLRRRESCADWHHRWCRAIRRRIRACRCRWNGVIRQDVGGTWGWNVSRMGSFNRGRSRGPYEATGVSGLQGGSHLQSWWFPIPRKGPQEQGEPVVARPSSPRSWRRRPQKVLV